MQVHGAPLLLHVVVDHTSRADWATALQLARYTLRIHDRWLAEHPNARRLPPVLPFVVHHGDRPWQAARSVDELVDLAALPPAAADLLRPLQLRLPFVLFDLAALDDAAIAALRLSVVTGLMLRFLQVLRGLGPAAALAQVVRWGAAAGRACAPAAGRVRPAPGGTVPRGSGCRCRPGCRAGTGRSARDLGSQ